MNEELLIMSTEKRDARSLDTYRFQEKFFIEYIEMVNNFLEKYKDVLFPPSQDAIDEETKRRKKLLRNNSQKFWS